MLQQGQGKGRRSTKARGDAAEDAALDMLQARGLRLLVRNYRMPGRGAAEIDHLDVIEGGVVGVD